MTESQQTSVRSASTIDVHWPGTGVAHVVLGGEHDLSTAGRLDKTLSETLEGCLRLVVDLRDTVFIDSSTIRALLVAKGRADARARQFSVVPGKTPTVERALELTGVMPALNRIHTLEEGSSNRAA
jgi:anti-anti-sigma factor